MTISNRPLDAAQQSLPDSMPVSLPDSFPGVALSEADDYAPISGSLPGTAAPGHDAPAADSGDWRQELSARLQAHRTRRANQQPPAPHALDSDHARSSISRRPRISSRATNAAATVAERYASAPSFNRYLESAGQFSLSDSPATQDDPPTTHGANALDLAIDFARELAVELAPEPARDSVARHAIPTGQPVFPAELAITFDAPASHRTNQRVPEPHSSEKHVDIFEPTTVEAATILPANLIEFPRQLIAARKARPRLAETPSRYAEPESAPPLPDPDSQLRIFEVEPDTISHTPAVESAHASAWQGPAWQGIQLDAPLPSPAALALPAVAFDLPLQAAPVPRRLMAGLVDLSLVLFGYLAFITIFAATSSQLPTGKPAVVGAAALLLAFFAAYQWIFFRWSDATPGMRYARIGLCTFSDENPTRSAMQWRLLALALSTAALGLGYLWALVDDDRLAWHDRISRIYLRGY